MLEPLATTFLGPTKESRRLSILLTIYHNPSVSQHQIGKLNDLSSAMVNNYVKELQNSGFLLISGDTNRTQTYHLTSPGIEELKKLLHLYSAEINKMYGNARNEINKIAEIADSLTMSPGREETEEEIA